MTEQQAEKNLALALMRAGWLTLDQVQAAARLREPGKGLAVVLVDLGWVSQAEVSQFNSTDSNFKLPPRAPGAVKVGSAPIQRRPVVRPATPAGGNGSGTNGREGEIAAKPSRPDSLSDFDVAFGPPPPDPVPSGADPAHDVVLEGMDHRVGDEATGTTARLCNQILLQAVQMGASDVHLEPRSKGMLPRFRVDGRLRSTSLLGRDIQPAVVSRMKLMASLDITETRRSQDGRFRANVAGRIFDFRVSTLPGIYGEKIVVRLLDHASLVTDLLALGFTQQLHAQFVEMMRRAHGMILVTGPTGSGKSTTLYAALASTLDETKHVVTVEDPVEYELEGVMQCHVHAEIGNTFAARLRSILRQDPDVILVGEIRDTETADIAVRAALTGHLLLSTLHTNSAAASVARLLDMGLQRFLIASSLSGVLAQRLVRLICTDCRQELAQDTVEYEAAVAELRLPAGTVLYHGRGCDKCHGTGHRGRVAIMELLNVDKEIRRAIMDGVDTDELHRLAASKGMRTLYQDGLEKLRLGITSAEEVVRALLGNEELEAL